MRIGVDAMGGDQAPAVEVRGCLSARSLLDEGDREEVQATIDRGRRIWNTLKRLPDPKTDAELQMILEQLIDIPGEAGTSAGARR